MNSPGFLRNPKTQAWILAALVFATRIPFLFDGYGHEEDSWGLVVNAMEMHFSGHYIASRFPGHPLQEFLYAGIWDQPAWVWNSLSTLFSVVAVIAFYRALKHCGFNFAFETALMLAFTPEFFISGTYTIDYVWALAFVMMSFLALVNTRYMLCGLLLGMAIGCRITSGIFLLPWVILVWNKLDVKQWFVDSLKIGLTCAIVGVLWYVPAYMQYGTSFFDYSDQFPYPSIAKVVYKATFGVFGLLGIAALLLAKGAWLKRKYKSPLNPPTIVTPSRMVFALVVIIILEVISYVRLPQKSGYLLAMVPFALMLVAMYSTKKVIRVVTILFVLSSFLFSINLTDPLRGADSSPLAMKFQVSGQEIFVDPVTGPIFSERSKRRNKMEYVERVCNYLDTSYEQAIIICGWWYNELKVHQWLNGDDWCTTNCFGPNRYIDLEFYLTCDELRKKVNTTPLVNGGQPKVYYLPEQDLYNDQMYGQDCTDEIAQPFPMK